jgi:DNA topoisomerase-3
VINACDAGREGELIFAYLYQLTKCKLPVKRAWMQTMTTDGIAEAFKHLRDGAQMPAWRTPPAAAARATG